MQQVVVAPHIYPPSISKATQAYDGAALFSRLSKSFGTLNKQGYCLSNGNCHQFALAIGETGTAFTNALDTPAMADFASYLANTGVLPHFVFCLLIVGIHLPASLLGSVYTADYSGMQYAA